MHRGTTAATTPRLLRGTGRRGVEEEDVVNTNASVGVEEATASAAAKKSPDDKDTRSKLALQKIKDHIETKKNNTNVGEESPDEEEAVVKMKENSKVDLVQEQNEPKIKDNVTEKNEEEAEEGVLVKEDVKEDIIKKAGDNATVDGYVPGGDKQSLLKNENNDEDDVDEGGVATKVKLSKDKSASTTTNSTTANNNIPIKQSGVEDYNPTCTDQEDSMDNSISYFDCKNVKCDYVLYTLNLTSAPPAAAAAAAAAGDGASGNKVVTVIKEVGGGGEKGGDIILRQEEEKVNGEEKEEEEDIDDDKKRRRHIKDVDSSNGDDNNNNNSSNGDGNKLDVTIGSRYCPESCNAVQKCKMVRNYYLATKKKSINTTANDDDDDTSPPKLNGGKIDAVLGNNTDKKENDDEEEEDEVEKEVIFAKEIEDEIKSSIKEGTLDMKKVDEIEDEIFTAVENGNLDEKKAEELEEEVEKELDEVLEEEIIKEEEEDTPTPINSGNNTDKRENDDDDHDEEEEEVVMAKEIEDEIKSSIKDKTLDMKKVDELEDKLELAVKDGKLDETKAEELEEESEEVLEEETIKKHEKEEKNKGSSALLNSKMADDEEVIIVNEIEAEIKSSLKNGTFDEKKVDDLEEKLDLAVEDGNLDETKAEELEEESEEALEEETIKKHEKENEKDEKTQIDVETPIDSIVSNDDNIIKNKKKDTSTMANNVVSNINKEDDEGEEIVSEGKIAIDPCEVNDPNFLYNGTAGNDCDFIAKNDMCLKLQTGMIIGLHYCPLACNMSLECEEVKLSRAGDVTEIGNEDDIDEEAVVDDDEVEKKSVNMCKDDKSFLYKDKEGYDCQYIGTLKPDKCLKLLDDNNNNKLDGSVIGVKYCPESCKMMDECLQASIINTKAEIEKEFESEIESSLKNEKVDEKTVAYLEEKVEFAVKDGKLDKTKAEELEEELEEGLAETYEKVGATGTKSMLDEISNDDDYIMVPSIAKTADEEMENEIEAEIESSLKDGTLDEKKVDELEEKMELAVEDGTLDEAKAEELEEELEEVLAETYEKDAAKGTESMLDENYTDDDSMRNPAKSLDAGKLNSGDSKFDDEYDGLKSSGKYSSGTLDMEVNVSVLWSLILVILLVYSLLIYLL